MRKSVAAGVLAAGLLLVSCSGQPAAVETTPSPSAKPTAEKPTGIEVPDVVGLDGWSALEKLESAGFVVEGTWDGEDTIPTETLDVSGQEPSGEERAERGSTVVLELDVPPLPDYETTEDGTNIAVVLDTVPTEREARWITWTLMQETRSDDGYFVVFNCSTGETAGADNRIANAKFAVGQRGAAATGLQAGMQETELVEGATCP